MPYRFKPFVICILSVFLITQACGCSRQSVGKPGNKGLSIEWLEYTKARETSRDENKIMLIYFTSSSDNYQGQMRRETFTDQKVLAYLQKHFVGAWVDPSDFPNLARRYGVEAVPRYCFVNARGKTLTSTGGMVKPDVFLSMLKYINNGAYTEMTFPEWR